MKLHEAAEWFRNELKGGKCSENCIQCNANEIALQAIEKQIPKTPLNKSTEYDEVYGHCPNCDGIVTDLDDIHVCSQCGQALDWKEGEE